MILKPDSVRQFSPPELFLEAFLFLNAAFHIDILYKVQISIALAANLIHNLFIDEMTNDSSWFKSCNLIEL